MPTGQMIKVTINSTTDESEYNVPIEFKISELIEELKADLSLPPDAEYHLYDHSNMRLAAAKRLSELGIKDGAVLRLLTIGMAAGRG